MKVLVNVLGIIFIIASVFTTTIVMNALALSNTSQYPFGFAMVLVGTVSFSSFLIGYIGGKHRV